LPAAVEIGFMTGKEKKRSRPEPRLARGFRDSTATDSRARRTMLDRLCDVFALYGFEALETPALEYADALGKFLPDQDRPSEGVFSFKDDDGAWLALRYDLTAPLARYVAQNYDTLPKPYRRYQVGPVWRDEKPGPGRFREFVQCDADTVGAASMVADAELCLMAGDALEAVGLKRSEYLVKVGNRKVLDGVLEGAGIALGSSDAERRRHFAILRAIDKLDRLGAHGVEQLLGKGRRDESGDFTKGAELSPTQIAHVLSYVTSPLGRDWEATFGAWRKVVGESRVGLEGIGELEDMARFFAHADIDPQRLVFDPSVVRGLEYYTGPVFEAVLTFPVTNEKGHVVHFGSVAGGGRYDGLVGRLKGIDVPATGISIGVDRLLAGLAAREKAAEATFDGPVVVLVMDPKRVEDFHHMARALREAGIRAEAYLGDGGMRAQLKYADKRRAPIAVIEGEDERAAGQVTLKDLALGARLSAEIETSEEWRKGQPAQISVPRASLVEAVRKILARNQSKSP
jgi:histidyl-tRNA synthetase